MFLHKSIYCPSMDGESIIDNSLLSTSNDSTKHYNYRTEEIMLSDLEIYMIATDTRSFWERIEQNLTDFTYDVVPGGIALGVSITVVGVGVVSSGVYNAKNDIDSINNKIQDSKEKAEAYVEASNGAGKANWNSKELLDGLANSGVKYNPDDLVAVTRTADGKIVWLENGNAQAGLNHVMNHADDFAKKGIAKDDIKDLVMTALNKGEIVGYQGKGTGRPIYKVTFNGEAQGVAITVGSNGFIVGANPKTLP